MHHQSRPQNRSDGPTAVKATQGSEGDPPPVGASAQTSRSDEGGERSFGHPESTGGGEPDSPSWYRTTANSPVASLGVFQTRSIFHLPRRTSSGYFSSDGDSLPSSPLWPRPVTADRATQTPSSTGQVMKHALQRMAEAQNGPGTRQQHGQSPSPSSTRRRNATGDMQTEAIGRELRRCGDDYNRVFLLRGAAGRHRRVVIYPNPLPHIHQEPTVLLCMGLLLLVIGRIIYLQGSTNSQDHSQV
ncbi:bcl-2-like protein 11 isoform X2 [Cottoperca gobio]|uniref:Bcl-2-like protein 11 isoform X2 n=1 Tax=Cottoperca gobio TaxID=56716 RepID=A0A6J2R8N8_COTGO|nr:bcl-2-like protein 11 isoform X2 [Cottoperca gobio]